jgi:hypothetical protein
MNVPVNAAAQLQGQVVVLRLWGWPGFGDKFIDGYRRKEDRENHWRQEGLPPSPVQREMEH